MCQEDLLALAMNNLYRLPVHEKMSLAAQGKHTLIPNSGFCQTVAKVSCPSLAAFITNAYEEIDLLREHFFDQSEKEAFEYPGNTLTTYVEEHRYGLDAGVEALVAAINLWPNVYTVNSCSGVHSGAWLPDGNGSFFCEDLIKFVSDDREALNQVSAILEAGAVGIRFKVSSTRNGGLEDKIASMPGFLVVDYNLGNNGPKTCRTYYRAMSFTQEPFDKLDCMLWAVTEDGPPLMRMHANLVGLFGTALELVQANPTLEPSDLQHKQLNELKRFAETSRKRVIFQQTKFLSSFDFMEPAKEMFERLEKDNWWGDSLKC